MKIEHYDPTYLDLIKPPVMKLLTHLQAHLHPHRWTARAEVYRAYLRICQEEGEDVVPASRMLVYELVRVNLPTLAVKRHQGRVGFLGLDLEADDHG